MSLTPYINYLHVSDAKQQWLERTFLNSSRPNLKGLSFDIHEALSHRIRTFHAKYSHIRNVLTGLCSTGAVLSVTSPRIEAYTVVAHVSFAAKCNCLGVTARNACCRLLFVSSLAEPGAHWDHPAIQLTHTLRASNNRPHLSPGHKFP